MDFCFNCKQFCHTLSELFGLACGVFSVKNVDNDKLLTKERERKMKKGDKIMNEINK